MFAESWDTFGAWAKVIAGSIGGIGLAIVTIFFLFRNKWMDLKARQIKLASEAYEVQQKEATAARLEAEARQKADRSADQESRAEVIRELKATIEDLRCDGQKRQAEMNRLQRTVTDKMMDAARLLGECEAKHAVMEERQKRTAADLEETKKELAENSIYTQSLEERITAMERGSNGGHT